MNKSYRLTSAPINQGALEGRYALRDLSNSGKFSNTINSIPVRYRLSCNENIDDKVLTLAEGSTVTFLDGNSDTNSETTLYEYYVLGGKYSFHELHEDVTLRIVGAPSNGVTDGDPNKYVYIVYNKSGNDGKGTLELGTGNGYDGYKFTVDNDTGNIIVDTTQSGSIYRRPMVYQEESNYWVGPNGDRTSVPLGYFDANWNLHAFNSLGFYEQIFWVDRDVEILIPDGRTDTFGMKVDNTSMNKITFTVFDGNGEHPPVINTEESALVLNSDGTVIATAEFNTYNQLPPDVESGYVYLSSDNYIYTVAVDVSGIAKNVQKCVKLCDVSLKDGLFSAITGENVYQAANLKDIKDDIEELQETTVHNTGDEEVAGEKTFTDTVYFDNSVHNYITINAGQIPDDGSLDVYGIINVEHSQEDAQAINDAAANNRGYDGSGGGIKFTADAYIVGVETGDNGSIKYTNTANCLNIVGASNAAKGGIILGRYRVNSAGTSIERITKIEGDGSGNLLFHADSLLPDGTMTIGTASKKWDKMYANRFEGLATSALWADLAEIYETDKEYPAGTLVAWGGEKELTVATDEVNAVISENPAYLMNSGAEGQPVALAGRVRVRIVDFVSKFDKIYLSSIPGVGSTSPRGPEDKPIARALEDKNTDGEGLVMCAVHFTI